MKIEQSNIKYKKNVSICKNTILNTYVVFIHPLQTLYYFLISVLRRSKDNNFFISQQII